MPSTTPAARAESTPALSSGKTSQECSVTEVMDSVASLLRLPEKTCRSNRQGESGRTLVLCLDPKGQSRGGSEMPNISAWPNDATVSTLSQVLVRDLIPQQYHLSSTACAGILRRAEKRGRILPYRLHAALSRVAGLPDATVNLTPEDWTEVEGDWADLM